MRDATVHRIEDLVRPSLAHLGVELCNVEWRGSSSGPRATGILRLVIDKPGGVSLDDCERVSAAVGAVLDAYDPIESRYSLEVSSPGAERSLSPADEWRETVGRRVNLTCRAGEGEVVIEGRLVAVSPGTVEVEVREGRNRRRLAAVARRDILAARIVVDI